MLRQFYKEGTIEAGCDEAGRGCLAGPVVAAAVILPPGYENAMINDSKKLTAGRRELLRREIENHAVAWAIGLADNDEIDNINILNASIMAMHRALFQLKIKPDHILVDGNRFISYCDIPHTCIIRGDSQFSSIAAASILAKTCRDVIMDDLHKKFPLYGWDRNKGYPTPKHACALFRHGPTPLHRKSFRIRSGQATLPFAR